MMLLQLTSGLRDESVAVPRPGITHLAGPQNQPNPYRWLRSSRFWVRCGANCFALDPESLTPPGRKISRTLIGGFVRRVFGSDAVPSELLSTRNHSPRLPAKSAEPLSVASFVAFLGPMPCHRNCSRSGITHLACPQNRPNPNRWLRSSRFWVRCRAIGIALDPESLTSPARKIGRTLIGGFVRRVFASVAVPSELLSTRNHSPRLPAKSAES